MIDIKKQLSKESEKLHKLIEKAIDQKGSITNSAVLIQSKKVDRLIIDLYLQGNEKKGKG